MPKLVPRKLGMAGKTLTEKFSKTSLLANFCFQDHFGYHTITAYT